MLLRHTLLTLPLIAALSACTAAQEKTPDAKPAHESAPPTSAPATVTNPMAPFARMVGGEWQVTAASGTSMYHTWHWGPGKHSLRVMTDGSDAVGNPWRALQAFYWHPGRNQVCLLGLNPYARSVAEGTIKFADESADAVIDLHQTGGRRKMGLRWDFDGPDKYHEILLEETGSEGFKPLAEWDHVRSKGPPVPPPPAAAETPKLAERLKAFEPLFGHTWEARGDWPTKEAFHIQTTFEWVPYADGIYARVLAPIKDGAPTHLLDAYFYHHTGTGALRCLTLSNRGGVYEGDLTVLDNGALQFDLKGYAGDQIVPHVVRFDFAPDGTPRQRVWSVNGTERTLLLDVEHRKLSRRKSNPHVPEKEP